MNVRPARPEDREALAVLRATLWPDGSVEAHALELEQILTGAWESVYPYVIFVAEQAGAVIGFVEVSMRSAADDCDPRRPVGYLEGWFVAEEHRRRQVGAALVRAAEAWARIQGCTEMASDTWLDNEPSLRAHKALGFEETDRVITFRKALFAVPLLFAILSG
jgi:aminoglycoside 6'-N-acetyltransferase I